MSDGVSANTNLSRLAGEDLEDMILGPGAHLIPACRAGIG